MSNTVSAFIAALQRIPDRNLATAAKKFRRICKRRNYRVVQLQCGVKDMRLWATVVIPGKRKLFVKHFRPVSTLSERKKLDILIPRAKIIGLPKICGMTNDWVIYEHLKRAYPKPIKRRGQVFKAIDHLLCIHKMPTGDHFARHSFFQPRVVRGSLFIRQIPKIAKTIRRYGAPAIASEQLLMLLEGRPFDFPVFNADTLKRYDFVLCHGGYVPKHLFSTPKGFRVIDWETATLFSRWYDVWLLSSFVSKDLRDILWSRYVQGYLAC